MRRLAEMATNINSKYKVLILSCLILSYLFYFDFVYSIMSANAWLQ